MSDKELIETLRKAMESVENIALSMLLVITIDRLTELTTITGVK